MEELVPFQVQLERSQHRRLKQLAEAQGRSMGALVRESLEAYVARLPAAADPLLEIIGMVDDRAPRPSGDVGAEHDAYLADAHAAEANPPSVAAPRRSRRSPHR